MWPVVLRVVALLPASSVFSRHSFIVFACVRFRVNFVSFANYCFAIIYFPFSFNSCCFVLFCIVFFFVFFSLSIEPSTHIFVSSSLRLPYLLRSNSLLRTEKRSTVCAALVVLIL